MSALDIVHAYEKSPLGQFFISINNGWVITFQIVHVFSILTVLTAIVLLALRAFGLFSFEQNNERFARLFFRVVGVGLGGAVVSGVLLFLTSATHYFTNKAFPFKLVFLAIAVFVEFVVFRKLFINPAHRTVTKFVALLSVILWFLTGFAGRAIGFV